MPQSHELLFALKRFVQVAAASEKTGESMLNNDELSAGRAVMDAIDKTVDARVQAILNAQLPRNVNAIVADRQARTPQRR